MVAECRTLLMMIGRIAFSSKLPWLPANATAVSSPMTWIAIMTMASHCVGLTSRHDRRSWFVLRQLQLTQAAARTRRQPAHVVRDLHDGDGDAAQRCRGPHHRIQRPL